ncbi:MAG: DUF819 family protein [Verrucomicrobiales bacterium]|nr:DUF819 family protein [Verrucomicrobiales bacterium]
MQPLVKPDDTWLLWAVIIAGTGLSIWLEQTYRWAAKISGPVIALVTAMILSNVRIMPMASPAYDFVGTYLVPLAIPLLLFRANALQIARTTGSMFVVFHISTIGTLLGAFLATWLLRGRVEQIEYAAGIMTGSYIGGGINFFAVKESFKVSETITNPLLVADNFVMAGLFIALLWIAGSAWFRRHFPHPHSIGADAGAAKNLAAEHWQRKGIALIDIAKSLAVAFAAVGLAELLRRFITSQFTPGKDAGILLQMLQVLLTNKFVLVTVVSLLCATLFHRPMMKVNGPEELGGYMLYLFLFVIGLPADLRAVLFNVPLLFVFCVIMAATNLVVTLAVGKLFRFNLEELLLCVNATVGGPPTAAAMAISTGWSKLVLPGLLVGIWGYVIGTALGVLVTETLLRL